MLSPAQVDALARRLLSPHELAHLEKLKLPDTGHGYDAFGAHPSWVRLGVGLLGVLYHSWFRVESRGSEHLPVNGPALIVANHSGTLPFDAMMLTVDILRNTSPPRGLRVAIDHFVPKLPFVSMLYSRWGAIGGSRENVRYLLRNGEYVGVFPEGVLGIGKPFRKRYSITTWREGHAELAIVERVPVVPVAIIGAEEQMPQLGRIGLPRSLGLPYFPITPTPLPLPVKYRIYYGEPLDLFSDGPADAARDTEYIEAQSQRVRAAVERLIAKGLDERRGVFW